MIKEKIKHSNDLFSDMDKPLPPAFWQKKGAIIAGIFSLVWFFFIVDYMLSSGWWAARGDLSPAEFVGGVGGLLMPIVIALLVAAYFDRSTQLSYESQTLQSYLNELVYPTQEGAVYTKTLTDALREQIKEFRTVFAGVQNQTQQVRGDLKQWIDDLSKVIHHVDTQTIDSVKEIAGHIHALTEATALANAQVREASALFADQAAVLTQVTEQTVQGVGSLSRALAENAREMRDIQEALTASNSDSNAAAHEARDITDLLATQSERIERAVGAYEASAKEQNARLFGNLEKILAVFKAHGDMLDQEVEKTANRVRVIESSFAQNAKGLFEVADAAVMQMEDVGVVFDEKARRCQQTVSVIKEDMEKLSDQLVQNAKELDTQTGGKMKRQVSEDFLKEAKIILDRLQTFSVDMAKLFAPKVEEQLWQRYNAGDKAAFMRHITKELSAGQVKKIKELFKTNAEFKKAVTHYMGEFEGMTKAAKKNDADLLMSVLVGSDVGRLYMVLADIFKKGK